MTLNEEPMMEKASEAFAEKFEAEIDSNVMELSLRDLH